MGLAVRFSALLVALLLPAAASAVSLPIVNAGFENPAVPDSQFVHDSPPGWSCSEEEVFDCGTMDLSVADFPLGAPEGENVVNLSRGGRIDQVLSSVLTPGTYTLSIQVGQFMNNPLSPYSVQLLAGGNLLAQSSSATPAPGTFQTLSFTFLAGPNHPALGSPLAIAIDLFGDSSVVPQFAADDVRLDYSPVPEPATPILVACGLICLGTRPRTLRAIAR
jgi:hypothetical protein